MGDPVFPVDCVAYCDESKYGGTARFRAVSCVSVSAHALPEVDGALQEILTSANKSDLGFADLRTANDCIVAAKLMRRAVEVAGAGVLQVRTLIWDAYDKRHGPGTDELRNLERMYVHLLRDVLGRRWSGKAWELRPDEQTALRWETMTSIVENAATKTAGRAIEVRHLAQQVSAKEPLVQVADLYAGLMSHYAYHGTAFERLLALPEEKRQRILRERIDPITSASDRERFKLLPFVIALHEDNGFPARLTPKGLTIGDAVGSRVYNWLYKPVAAEDKAPRRGQDDEAASYFYECREPGCGEIVELRFESHEPFCGRHYAERHGADIERRQEREQRREAERTYREGSHYCGDCGYRGTPSSTDLERAQYIGRQPQCPACRRWGLISLIASDGDAMRSTDDLMTEFEQRHNDRWRGR